MGIIQNRALKQVVLIDQADKVVGMMDIVVAHGKLAPLHRAVSIVIVSPDHKKMLITKRSKNKFTWPSYWSNTVCTHPKENESYYDTAMRRLPEEMGFSTELEEKFSFKYKASMNEDIWEHELDHVFVGRLPIETKFVPDKNEIAEWKWISVSELKRDIAKNPKEYTPWFGIILKKLKL